ncbi:MAG: galactokinase [Ruminococcaceae bacterium]|nr:galactokinase [Oscillospiraceae bacterium]
MKPKELKKIIKDGALSKYSHLYSDIKGQTERFIKAIDSFTKLYGQERDISIFSVPGRSEISGNHTDHNNGCVLAGSIDRDIIAIAAKSDANKVNVKSEGYPLDTVELSDADKPEKFKKFTSSALIGGMIGGFMKRGEAVGGFDAYLTSDVLKGSGLSSSAAYEVMIGNILNHLYSDGRVENANIAVIAQYAENLYFGKPCGLMDQIACAVGGFVYIDFENPTSPVIEPIKFSLADAGYTLCIVNTRGNHADLNDDYAAVPGEMKTVAKLLGRDVLRGLTEEEIIKNFSNIRRVAGDRAILRSLHFMRENKRVARIREALKRGDTEGFLKAVSESAKSSFQYLQNVYTPSDVREQGLSVALALSDGYLEGKSAVSRVHGGGFAGTVQTFLKTEDAEGYVGYMNSVFGDGACEPFNVRPDGAVKLF